MADWSRLDDASNRLAIASARMDAVFNEADHPRAKDGKFGSGSSSHVINGGDKKQVASLKKDIKKQLDIPNASSQRRNSLIFMKRAVDDLKYNGNLIAKHGKNGDLQGVVSWKVSGKTLKVPELGSLEKGTGTELMRAVEQIAYEKGLDIELDALDGAESFYLKLGYKNGAGPQMIKSLSDIKKEVEERHG